MAARKPTTASVALQVTSVYAARLLLACGHITDRPVADWPTARQLIARAGLKQRTGHTHLKRLVEGGAIVWADISPGPRYALAQTAHAAEQLRSAKRLLGRLSGAAAP